MKRIDIQNLSFSYKKSAPIFKDLNLRLSSTEGKGKISVVMGTSGAGKSTLLKILLNIEHPQQGQISLSPQAPVISYVPQEPVLFEHLSVEENATYFQFAGAYRSRFNQSLYNELIEDLGLRSVLEQSKSVTQLSGGQKQRLSLLRALSINPDFVFLDEPCNGLDAEVKRSFLNKLREITETYGLFVLYVTHHKLEAQLIADEIIYLHKNKQGDFIKEVARGTARQFVSAPPLIEAAKVFNFPDVKILSGFRNSDDQIEITRDTAKIKNYWLVRDENLRFDTESGITFRVVSKSDAYAVIVHAASDTEWLLADGLVPNLAKGRELKIALTGELITYDAEGKIVLT